MFRPFADPALRRVVIQLYIASVVLFLVNNLLGFFNVFVAPDLPYWQELAHVHAGTLGWLTLGVLATGLWLFAGGRRLTPAGLARIRVLAWTAVASIAGYVLAFALAFGVGGAAWVLLPIFGIATAAVIATSAATAVAAWRRLPLRTTSHTLYTLGLVLAAVGAVFGVLFGLQYALGSSFLGSMEPVAHFITMDLYAIACLAAIIEAHVTGPGPMRWLGILHAALLALGSLTAVIGFSTGAEPVIGVAFPIVVASLLVYVIRIGWRPLADKPFGKGRDPARFWAGLGFLAYLVFLVGPSPEDGGEWMEIALVHALGVGAATNLLLATHARLVPIPSALRSAAVWTLNVGLVLFIGGEAAQGVAWGAIIMGVGVVAAVVTSLAHLLRASRIPVRARA